MASYVSYNPTNGHIEQWGTTQWEYVEKYISGEMGNSLGLKTIPVPLNGSIWQLFPDYWTAEQKQTLYVNLDTKQLRTTVADLNYPAPTVSLDQTSYSVIEGNIGNKNAGITITLSAPSAMPTFVFFKTTDESAISLNKEGVIIHDYDPQFLGNNSVTFAPGETRKTLPITILGDSYGEGNKTFAIDLVYPSGILFKSGDQSINGTHANVTIVDDDPIVDNNSLSTTQWQNGTTGNDTFKSTQSGINDRVDGKGGFDSVVYSHARADYNISKMSEPYSGWTTVADKTAGRDGVDSIVNVSDIKFTDGTLAIDISNSADNSLIYRLYQASFARTPDEGGFRYWVGKHETGLAINDMATLFRTSAEFTQRYGSNLTNAEYVDQLYKNVLGRVGEKGGTDYWNGVLNSNSATKDQVLVGFAGSPENVTKTAGNTSDGYWFL